MPVFLTFTLLQYLPVVRAGVHSCSPVAPHKYVKDLDGVVPKVLDVADDNT